MKKDYFSTQSDRYKLFRPTYPNELFAFLCRDLGPDSVVWDCATGNGQAAAALKRYAAAVIATDHSAAQLAYAIPAKKIYYVQAFAEEMPLADKSVDLITVAQALHWFDFDRFYAEAKRVLKLKGRIAAWTYSFLSVSPQLGSEIDEVIRWFYHDVVGPYWPQERRWVDERYRSIPFPFSDINSPPFTIEVAWDLAGILGYMSSWSAVQRYLHARDKDPMPFLNDRLKPLWGDPAHVRALSWRIELRFGQVF